VIGGETAKRAGEEAKPLQWAKGRKSGEEGLQDRALKTPLILVEREKGTYQKGGREGLSDLGAWGREASFPLLKRASSKAQEKGGKKRGETPGEKDASDFFNTVGIHR